MSKKRGANSPNVSEKSKAKPSAAAATLSMASMLSVMSGAFSTQGASSQVTDSEDDYQSQVEDGTDVQPPNQASNNVWNEENLQNSRYDLQGSKTIGLNPYSTTAVTEL